MTAASQRELSGRTAVVARFHLAQVCLQLKDHRRALTQLHLVKELQPNYAPVYMLQGDIFTTPDAELLGPLAAFDVVLSDMAPNTTGVRATDQARSAALFEEALGRAERMLAPGGAFVGKIFQGPDLEAIRRRMATRFQEVKTIKPEGSRAQSIEIYLAGKGFA